MSYQIEYHDQFDSLEKIVIDVNEKSLLLSSDPSFDPFFIDNLNFFTKSFLVIICAYLESFIKDITYSTIQNYDNKLKGLGIPTNLTRWSFDITTDKLKKKLYEELRFVRIKKKDLDRHISGSPYRTEQLLENIGIDLRKNEQFNDLRDKIQTIVTKRNNIVHHNDDASDITLADILDYIRIVKKYIEVIDSEIQNTLDDYSYQHEL